MQATVKRQSTSYYWHYNKHIFNNISAEYFNPGYWQAQDAVIGNETGRGTTWFVHHNGYDLVLRHYLRGGLIRKLSRDHYIFTGWQSSRSIAEYDILCKLHTLDLPVPRPAAAQTVRGGLFYQAVILIERIPDAQDLVQALQTRKSADFYQMLGRTIARFHTHGVFHADLNIQNILHDQRGKFWLIDFDRARLVAPQVKWQKDNMNRLLRSFHKEQQRHGIKWQDSDWTVLLDAYSIAMKQATTKELS